MSIAPYVIQTQGYTITIDHEAMAVDYTHGYWTVTRRILFDAEGNFREAVGNVDGFVKRELTKVGIHLPDNLSWAV